MMSFNDFIHKYKTKNKATSIIKICQVLPSLSLNDVRVYLGGGPFKSDIGTVSLGPSKGTHRVLYINDNFLYSFGGSTPQKLSKSIIKRNGH